MPTKPKTSTIDKTSLCQIYSLTGLNTGRKNEKNRPILVCEPIATTEYVSRLANLSSIQALQLDNLIITRFDSKIACEQGWYEFELEERPGLHSHCYVHSTDCIGKLLA